MKNGVKFGKELFVGQFSHSHIKDHYDFISKIGKGGMANVYEVRNKITKDIRACKHLSKGNIKESDLEKFRREIRILMKTDHPNIIKLYEVFETDNSLYLVMEKCNGGELFEKIINNISDGKMFSEKMAAHLISQVMSAIDYCHQNGICHRDLKPENILFLNKGNDNINLIKVIDFGLGQILGEKFLKSKVGTPYYVSPEVLNGEYSQKCDIWSVGVILCILLTGEPPFNGPTNEIILRKIKKYEYCFSDKWAFISNEAKDLVSHMLVPENVRYNASEVLTHPWFKIIESNDNNIINLDLSFFKSYNKTNTFKKIILTFIASRMDNNNIYELTKLFEAFDINKDGLISYEEFNKILSKKKELNESEIREIFNSIDTDKNGKITYTEFLASCLEENIYLNQDRLIEAFSLFDKNNKGVITKEEIMSVLQLTSEDSKEIDDLIKMIDTKGDDVIDMEELGEFMKK